MIALVTAAAARHLDEDLPLLSRALGDARLDHEIVVWDDASVDWARFDLAVVRSTWDYAPRRDEYVAWARQVPRLANPADVIAWNTDKRYLRDLARAGIAVTPTTWIEPGDAPRIPDGEIVVKPAVSAGARDTARYAPDARASAIEHVKRLQAEGRTAMVQPYLSGVDEHGETALLFFGGVFSHAIRKGPILIPGAGCVEGLFAKEDISPRAPSEAERALAERTLERVPGGRDRLLYARVDVVPGPDGAPMVLELELSEPSVFLGHAPGAAERFARAIAARAARRGR
jgi:glutathione synthase/RimK-type ligase-like ATP-grasp enzyme